MNIADFGNSKFSSIFEAVVNLPIILILYHQTVDIISQHKYIECDDQYRLLIHEFVRSQTVYKYHSSLIVKHSILHLAEPHVATRCKALGNFPKRLLVRFYHLQLAHTSSPLLSARGLFRFEFTWYPS